MALSPIYHNEVRRSKLFAAFEREALQKIFQNGRMIHLRAGDRLFRKGDPALHFYVVRTGNVKQFLTSSDGHEKTLDVIRPGSAVGELQMFLAQAEYHCNCEMLENGELFEFNAAAYTRLLQQNPAYALPLMNCMSEKILQQTEEIGNLTLTDARHRLSHYIFSQIECKDKHHCDPNEDCAGSSSCSLTLPTSKATIASLLSIQRETFSRILGKMKAEAMIGVQGSQIEVTDLKRLRESIRC